MINKTKGRLFILVGGLLTLTGGLAFGAASQNQAFEEPYSLWAIVATLAPIGCALAFYGQHKWKFPGRLSFSILFSYAVMILGWDLFLWAAFNRFPEQGLFKLLGMFAFAFGSGLALILQYHAQRQGSSNDKTEAIW